MNRAGCSHDSRARSLLHGASSRYEPEVHEEWAEFARMRRDEATRKCHLREAHRLYTEMGATGHAERVGRELS